MITILRTVFKNWHNFSINSNLGSHEIVNREYPYQTIDSGLFYKKIIDQLTKNKRFRSPCYNKENNLIAAVSTLDGLSNVYISNLDSIKYLDLDNNAISILPESFNSLGYLEVLWLGRNPLNYIPSSIFDLSNLRLLGFYSLHISESDTIIIPSEIETLNNKRSRSAKLRAAEKV